VLETTIHIVIVSILKAHADVTCHLLCNKFSLWKCWEHQHQPSKSPSLGHQLRLSSNPSQAKAIIEPSSLAGFGPAYLGLAWLGPWLEAGLKQH
jgi:hypothetical protein